MTHSIAEKRKIKFIGKGKIKRGVKHRNKESPSTQERRRAPLVNHPFIP